MQPEIALLILLPAATAGVALLLWKLRLRLHDVRMSVLRETTLREEIRIYETSRAELIAAQKVAEKSVDVGTDTVRLAHNLIAAIPFTVLENIPATREGAKAARKAHDRIAGNVYDSLTIANKLIGHGLRQTLKPSKEQKTPPQSQPKRE